MFRLRFTSALAALVVFTAGLSAADNPTVKAIKAQIQTLKAQEKVTKKAVHDWYEGFIKRDSLSEDVMRAERKVLLAQEEDLLAVTSDPTARTNIKAHYETLRGYLRTDIKLDAAAKKQLGELRKVQETFIANSYKAKIAELELAAKIAAQKK